MGKDDTPPLMLGAIDLLALVETSRDLASELDLRALLPRILARAGGLTGSPDGSIILYDPERKDLYFAEAIGSASAMLMKTFGPNREKGIPLEGSKAGQVFTSGRSLKEDVLAGDTQHFKGVDQATKSATESMICVPLSVGDERLGVMQLLNKQGGDYTPRDLTLLEHFASQAAVALRNATLVRDVLAHMGWYEAEGTGSDALQTLRALRKPAHSETLTVMFADMRGYNQLCQELDRPEQVQTVMNEYLTELASAVLAAGGIVNKFIGDAVLALFRGENTAVRAVRCAEHLTRQMVVMRDRWDANTNASLDFLDIGVGIATDEVILGSIGTARVRDFTVLGTGVNLAAHLTRDARGGRHILVDKRTYKAVRQFVVAEGPETFELKKPDQLKGRTYERYWIKGLEGSAAQVPAPVMARETTERDSVFISYSHHDAKWLERLQVHIKPLTKRRRLAVWDDTKIKPGAAWKEEIRRALATAKVAVLMVSPNFLASDFITDEEVPPLLAAAKQAGLTVLWFVVSACSYEETDIQRYQAVLDPKKPLAGLSDADVDAAFVKICREIGEAVK